MSEVIHREIMYILMYIKVQISLDVRGHNSNRTHNARYMLCSLNTTLTMEYIKVNDTNAYFKIL